MLITPDLSEVTDPVEPGTYKVNVVGGKLGEWEGKDGKPNTKFINFEMETFDEADAKNNGRKIWDRVPYTGKGAFRMQNFYSACTGEGLSKESGGFDLEQLIGRQLEISVDKDAKGYTNVKSVKAIG